MKLAKHLNRWQVPMGRYFGIVFSAFTISMAPNWAEAQSNLTTVKPSVHPALAACQKRFRLMSITVGVPFAPATMLELCSTVEASCTAETERSRDCQNAIADVEINIAASFGLSDKKMAKAR